ncbi:pyrroloquinoline quinone biosynthesis protein PqqF [Pseudomonas sp. GD03842]|uniref:pyrroloquinoline quinone biosynthesis protein PqqF n=1 Tax=Pseudomonas sp. GD03842 TaxID=2975385 RepID=UPI00244A269A|nr:pyrroloquinoline quinone biosynthesis protein PqqF [Pseudomonas sp. GD03842]MDH0747407.1 pyrroloquinoline quinone biosynthesis protein PqqF [Pseudomonas sp. GD03842]
MSASASSRLRTLTLPNGLRVVLCSAPRLKRCAAALRVAAGSHDVPSQWPGLAHFLEHLFFLGTERFPAGNHLMAYVQRHGGQVNASTRERTTDFFFELPPPAFAGGLERLCEMLAHPRLSLDDQLREREVLHAEFIAWSRDEASRSLIKRLQSLSAAHPLRGFHAGNRFSLPVLREGFQQALQGFFRTYYQAGQMTLSLSGPQLLDDLQALATGCGEYFAKGAKVEPSEAPALIASGPAACLTHVEQRRLHVMLAADRLPKGHERAAEFLCTWINNARPGALGAHLRERGLADSLNAQVHYAFAGQVLIDIEVTLTAGTGHLVSTEDETCEDTNALAMGPSPTHLIRNLVLDWLVFFKTHCPKLLPEYARLQNRQLEVASALALARHHSVDDSLPGLHDDAALALEALLAGLIKSAGVESSKLNHWRLPGPNPFLQASSAPVSRKPIPPALVFSEHLPATGEASVYLRWTLETAQPTLFKALNARLEVLVADAHQAGVTLVFSAYGPHWELKLSGCAEPFPAILEHALQLLAQPIARLQDPYGQAAAPPKLMPIRQLLKTLPDHYLNSAGSEQGHDVQAVWDRAHWIGFAVGLHGDARNALACALSRTPGTPVTGALHPGKSATLPRWAVEPSDSSEDAVLLFLPTPSGSIEEEAVWRVFAQLIQGPFYQRLRGELQLGYAVFSGFRQIAGQSGLLWGVQSPTVHVAQLVEHVREVLNGLPALVERADLNAVAETLKTQLTLTAQDGQAAAETLWQAHLAGHGADYPERLQHSLSHLQRQSLGEIASGVALPQAPVLYLSNRALPGGLRLVQA